MILLAAVVSGLSAIVVGIAASLTTDPGDPGSWMLWAAAVLLIVAYVAFACEDERRERRFP